MAPERLCLGCGLRVDGKFTPIFPGERGPLFAASVKLLKFALRVSSASTFAKELTEEEEVLRQAIRPLVMNPDCHFLEVLTVLVQSILEGGTDCPISGIFGAGKTRAAAAMIAGLLVMDPTLKVIVVTKRMQRRMPSPSTLNPCSFHSRWKRNLVGWWVPLNWRKAQPAKRSSISHQATATLSYAPSKLSLVAEAASTRYVRSRIAR